LAVNFNQFIILQEGLLTKKINALCHQQLNW